MIHPATLRGFRLITHLIVVLFFMHSALAQTATRKHDFVLDTAGWDEKPRTVHVAGSFNGWSRDANPLTNKDGVWKAALDLPEGIHYYKFVIDGDRWVNDPNSDKELEIDDNYGGKNSAVLIGPDARKLPAPRDNHINTDGILFAPEMPEDVNVATRDLLRLRIRVQADDVKQAFVNFKDSRGDHKQQLFPAGKSMGYESFATAINVHGKVASFWFSLEDGEAKVLLARDGVVAAGDAAVSSPAAISVTMTPKFETPEWAKKAVWYQIFPDRFRNGDPSNDPGDKWYERRVDWKHDWWKAAPGETPGDGNFYKGAGNVWKRRYGGDIQGVQQALPYLRELGINAIYFNPIFEAESMHKYDTADYRHIDDNFGEKNDNEVAIAARPVPEDQKPYLSVEEIEKSEKPSAASFQLYELDGTPVPSGHVETDDPTTWKWTKSDLIFLAFLEEAHKQGFKVILDGVFNHVGRAHPFFQDVLEKGKDSPYADWFEITDWGDKSNWKKLADPYQVHGKPGGIRWKAWDSDDGHLPVFKKDKVLGLAKGPRDHIFAITKRWLAPGGDPKKGIDGWRLDVPGDIPHPFWIEWRKVVKEAQPEGYISGELWGWAQPWLNNGDQFDAVMNYRFAAASQDFFVNQSKAIKPTQLSSRLYEMIFNYPLQVALVQQNLFDSHDTDRFASMFVNPDLAYDASNRIQDNGPAYSDAKPDAEDRSKMKLAVTLQHTFVGAPMTYYGNETGMWSPDDPSNRQPMWWREMMPYQDPRYEFDEDLFRHYQRVIALRRQLPALSLGFYHTVLADDSAEVFVFAREYEGQTVYVALNRGGEERSVEISVAGERFVDLLDEQSAELKAELGNAPDARPIVAPIDGAQALQSAGGKLKLTLKPFEDAVITEMK